MNLVIEPSPAPAPIMTIEELVIMLKRNGVEEYENGTLKIRFPYAYGPAGSSIAPPPVSAPPPDPLENQRLFLETLEKARKEFDKAITDEDILDDPYIGLDQYDKKDETNGPK